MGGTNFHLSWMSILRLCAHSRRGSTLMIEEARKPSTLRIVSEIEVNVKQDHAFNLSLGTYYKSWEDSIFT